MTVGELLSKMSSYEMTQWRALYEIEADERKRASQMAANRKGRKI